MAKYDVTRSCGHVEVVSLIGKMSARKWRLDNVEPNRMCSECYQKHLQEQREKANKEAAEAAKEMELPELQGTEKQVIWANTLRVALIEKFEVAEKEKLFEAYVVIDSRLKGLTKTDFLLIRDYILANKINASFYIDNRNVSIKDIAVSLKDNALAPLKEVAEQKQEDEIKIEATVRPDQAKGELVAEISIIKEDIIEIIYPARNDTFYDIVKKQLGMTWVGTWQRKVSAVNGTPADRAAEAGHRLLAAGFPIRIFDEAIRAKAIAGEYEPEQTNWILRRIKGEYEGWLAIVWGKKDDYYKAAKRISGSRYSKYNVVVPLESFEEILDFAERYGFRLSEGARDAVEKARSVKENILVAKVEPVDDTRKKVVIDGVPPVLEVPVEVGIADEFRD